jgi:hypothetical protein
MKRTKAEFKFKCSIFLTGYAGGLNKNNTETATLIGDAEKN